jgi:hypothetical protein
MREGLAEAQPPLALLSYIISICYSERIRQLAEERRIFFHISKINCSVVLTNIAFAYQNSMIFSILYPLRYCFNIT